eukprot:s813_g9.t1
MARFHKVKPALLMGFGKAVILLASCRGIAWLWPFQGGADSGAVAWQHYAAIEHHFYCTHLAMLTTSLGCSRALRGLGGTARRFCILSEVDLPTSLAGSKFVSVRLHSAAEQLKPSDGRKGEKSIGVGDRGAGLVYRDGRPSTSQAFAGREVEAKFPRAGVWVVKIQPPLDDRAGITADLGTPGTTFSFPVKGKMGVPPVLFQSPTVTMPCTNSRTLAEKWPGLIPETFQLDGSFRPSVREYTAGITWCGRAKLWEEAWMLMDEMTRTQVRADTVSYNAIISACGKGSQWQQALELLEGMPVANVRSDVISYNAAISACEKAGQWELALTLFEEMPKARIRLDIISYSAAISACEKGGEWQRALFLFKAMPAAKICPQVISYNAAISACEKGGQWEWALALFNEIARARDSPNIISYSAAISAYEKGGQWQPALVLLETMPAARVDVDVISCNAAMSACEKVRQWHQCMNLFDEMPNSKLRSDVISYQAVLSACEQVGQWEHVLRFIEGMPQARISLDGISYQVHERGAGQASAPRSGVESGAGIYFTETLRT